MKAPLLMTGVLVVLLSSPSPAADPRENADRAPVIRVWILGPLKHVQVGDLAGVIRELYGASRPRRGKPNSGFSSLGVDQRTNTLVLYCSQPVYEDIAKVAKQLDDAARDAATRPASVIQVVPLKNARATDVVKLLRELYRGSAASATFGADQRTNTLVVRCARHLDDELHDLVAKLDARAGDIP
jgi:type II secretory pathway component GspD/PulD (secretin)